MSADPKIRGPLPLHFVKMFRFNFLTENDDNNGDEPQEDMGNGNSKSQEHQLTDLVRNVHAGARQLNNIR
jgi:hypothetical protein